MSKVADFVEATKISEGGLVTEFAIGRGVAELSSRTGTGRGFR